MEKGKYLLRYFQERGMCGLTHPAAPLSQPHSLRPVALHAVGDPGSKWVLPVAAMAVEIYNMCDI